MSHFLCFEMGMNGDMEICYIEICYMFAKSGMTETDAIGENDILSIFVFMYEHHESFQADY